MRHEWHLLLPAMLLLQSCATVTTGTGQTITVVTERDVQGANCVLTDQENGEWKLTTTPGDVTVTKGGGPMTVVCRKEGYRDGSVLVDEDVVGATYGNILIGGVIGIAIDAASGASQNYPEVITIWMKPVRWESLEERIEWLRQKRVYMQEFTEQRD